MIQKVLARLCDTFVVQFYNVSTQMSNIAFETQKCLCIAEEISPAREEPAYLVDTDGFSPIETCFFPPPPTLLLFTPYPQNYVARFPIRILITLTLKYHFMTLRHPWPNIECVRLHVFDDLLAAAMRAFLNNNRSAATTFVTCGLCLGKHAREDLLFRNLDT